MGSGSEVEGGILEEDGDTADLRHAVSITITIVVPVQFHIFTVAFGICSLVKFKWWNRIRCHGAFYNWFYMKTFTFFRRER